MNTYSVPKSKKHERKYGRLTDIILKGPVPELLILNWWWAVKELLKIHHKVVITKSYLKKRSQNNCAYQEANPSGMIFRSMSST